MVQLEPSAYRASSAAILESWLLIEEAVGKADFIQGAAIPIFNPIFY